MTNGKEIQSINLKEQHKNEALEALEYLKDMHYFVPKYFGLDNKNKWDTVREYIERY